MSWVSGVAGMRFYVVSSFNYIAFIPSHRVVFSFPPYTLESIILSCVQRLYSWARNTHNLQQLGIRGLKVEQRRGHIKIKSDIRLRNRLNHV